MKCKKWAAGLLSAVMLFSMRVDARAAGSESTLPVEAGEVIVESISGDSYENSGYFPKDDKVKITWRNFKPFYTGSVPDEEGKNRYAAICDVLIRTTPQPGYVLYSDVFALREIDSDEVVFDNIEVDRLNLCHYVASFTDEKIEPGSGNKYQRIPFKIDYEAPEITNVSVEYQGSGDGVPSRAVIHVEARDWGSGLSSEAYSIDGGATWQSSPDFTVFQNMKYAVLVRDKTHLISASEADVEGLDSQGPEIKEITVQGTDSKNGYSKEVRVEVSAEDAESGLAKEAYSFDGGMTFTSQNPFTIDQNGPIKVVVRDRAGNCTEQEIVITEIDRTGPELQKIRITPLEEQNGYGTQAEVTVELSDTQAGLAEAPVSFDEGLTYVKETAKRYTENGNYRIFMKDALGNISEASFEIRCIDRDAPEVEIEKQEGSVSVNGFYREVGLSVRASDAQAGLAQKAYSYDRGITWTDSPDKKITENMTVDVWVRDALGNIAKNSMDITGIDSDGPVVGKIERTLLNQSGKFGTELVLTVHAMDAGAGLAEKPYSFDGGKNFTDSPVWNVKENSVVSLVIRDALSNETRREIQVSEIDRSAPAGSISGNPKEKVNKNVVLTFTGNDAESGIAALWYQSDRVKIRHLIGKYDGDKTVKEKVTITTNGIYRFIVQDMVGNTAEYTVNVTKIDKNSTGGNSGNGSGTGNTGNTGNTDSGSSGGGKEDNEDTVVIGDSRPADENSPSSGNHKTDSSGQVDATKKEDGKKSSDSTQKGGKTKVVKLSENQAGTDDGNEADNSAKEKDKGGNSKETVESLLKENLSQPEELQAETGESVYPEMVEEKGISMKKIAAATLGLLLLLGAAAFGILWYMGIIVPGKKEDEDEEEEES